MFPEHTDQNPYAGKSIFDLEAVRAQLEHKLDQLREVPLRTDAWEREVQGIKDQLTLVRAEISVAGSSVVSQCMTFTTPYNPFEGKSIMDLEAVRVQLERRREVLDNTPSRTEAWAREVQQIEAQLVQVGAEISIAGGQVVQGA